MRKEKSTYFITAMQDRSHGMLHGFPKEAAYEETFEALEDRSGNQDLPAAYRSHLKLRTQCFRESLQEFATAVEQLAHRPYPALKNQIREEAAKAFRNEVEDPGIKSSCC
jgi:hypothetical protein